MGKSKKHQLVATGKQLFWKYGIKRVTVEEICKKSNVSKMTFYKHFKDKNELVKYIIHTLSDDAIKKYRAIMDSDIPYNEKVKRSIDLKMEQTKEISSEFITDFYAAASQDLHEFFNELIQENTNYILNDFIKAQKDGDVRQDLNPQFILYFFNKMVDMAQDTKLRQLYDSPQQVIEELTKFFFYGVLKHD